MIKQLSFGNNVELFLTVFFTVKYFIKVADMNNQILIKQVSVLYLKRTQKILLGSVSNKVEISFALPNIPMYMQLEKL